MESKLYITRRKDLFDHTDNSEITLQEWTNFVANDPDMRLENETTVTLPDGTDYRYPSPGKAIWLNRQPGERIAQEVIFDYASGNIIIDDPDAATLKKIRHIAFKLNTRVFKETPHDTGQVLEEQTVLVPRFSFGSMMAPFKKVFLHIGHLFHQAFFSLFSNSPEKLVRNSKDKKP
ncbi:hypothetical protein [Paraflavitalea speifideaquila]|uniref:hypothetical protein n=1 Tax=Paraflavitalea speifideaquila TaxID=3076558 RepID=UPI0028E89E70|nr:hypothetical protein [Paraflavitalea speifideiaquila]